MSASVMLHGARLGAATLSLLVAFGPALGHAEPAAGPRAAQRVYEVKAGDTLTSLARKYGVTVAAIVKSNKLPSTDAPLKVGQHLVIPVSDTGPLSLVGETRLRVHRHPSRRSRGPGRRRG